MKECNNWQSWSPSDLPDLQTLVYQRPDIDRFINRSQKTKRQLQKWQRACHIGQALDVFFQSVDDFYLADRLTKIKAWLHPNDLSHQEEVDFFLSLKPSVKRLVTGVIVWLFDKPKPVQDFLLERYGELFLLQIKAANITNHNLDQSQWLAEQSILADVLVILTDLSKLVDSSYADYFRLINVRNQLALSQKLPDYLAYNYLQKNRFGFAPEDGQGLDELIKRYFKPMLPYLGANAESNTKFNLVGYHEVSGNLQELDDFLSVDWSIDLVDIGHGLNSIANRMGLPLDFILKLQKAGYININHQSKQDHSMACEFIPKVNLPYIMAKAVSRPNFLADLIGKTGLAYAYIRRRELFDLSMLIKFNSSGQSFVTTTYSLLTHKAMNTIYGRRFPFYRQWHLRYIVIQMLYLAMIDAFQSYIYQIDLTPQVKDIDLGKLYDEFKCSYFGDYWYLAELLLPEANVDLWHSDFWFQPLESINHLLGNLTAAFLWQQYRNQPEQGLDLLNQFIDSGNTKSFLEKIKDLGLGSPFSEANIKNLAFYLGYEMGY